MTALARTLHVARVDEGKKERLSSRNENEKIGPAPFMTYIFYFNAFCLW
jgi:hypothetical protein